MYKNYIIDVAKKYNINCMRISPWIGTWEYTVGLGQNGQPINPDHHSRYLYYIDKCVEWAEAAGIYAIVNMHMKYNTGLDNYTITKERLNDHDNNPTTPSISYSPKQWTGTTLNGYQKTRDFWNTFAPRYKDKTHVVYEAVNEPDYYSVKREMAGIYQHIRAMAPDTHIICWSVADPGILTQVNPRSYADAPLPNESFGLSDLQAATGIDYSNASVAWHYYHWSVGGDQRRIDRVKQYRAAGYPVICTEFFSLTNADNFPVSFSYTRRSIRDIRAEGISWISWAPRMNVRSYHNDIVNADGSIKMTGLVPDASGIIAKKHETSYVGFHVDLDNDGDADNGANYDPATDKFTKFMMATSTAAEVIADGGTNTPTTEAQANTLLNDSNGNRFAIDFFPNTDTEFWRREYFLTIDNTNAAADTFDADNDGVTNLMEYATDTNPILCGQAQHPRFSRSGTINQITFRRARQDLNYIIQNSTNMLTWNSFSTNPGTVGGDVTVTNDSTTGKRRFYRLQVARP